MSNCENFKRPRQLGLSIYTSDVSLYDGANLECVDLPDNPSLNDVIEAFGEKFCSLITLINNFESATVVIPNDPWVSLMDNAVGITDPQGTSGGTTYNSVSVNVAYKVISEDAAIVKCKTILDVTLDGDPTRVLNYSFYLDNIAVGASEWFPTLEKSFQGIFPDALDVNAQNIGVPIVIYASGGEGYGVLDVDDYDSQGRAGCSSGLFFVQLAAPKITTPGTYLMVIEWEMTVQLETVVIA